MRRAVTVMAVAGFVAAGFVLATPVASADPGCLSCSDVGLTPDGLLARARTQMNELNSVASNPPRCNDEMAGMGFPEDGNDTVEYEGHVRWRLTLNEQHVWDDDTATTGYRKECYVPGHPDVTDMALIEVRIFDAITPEILAQVAIDEMLGEIPTQTIRTSPQNPAMVAIPTWFWVDGVPAGGVSATAQVPDILVEAQASPGGVRYDFGDGTGMQCTGTGTPYTPGATSDCTHDYQRAGVHTVTSTILWTGTYTVTSGGTTTGPYSIDTAVPRTDTFQLTVNEAQAINDRDG